MLNVHSLLRYSTVTSVVTGIMLIANQGSQTPFGAQLSGQGSSLAIETGLMELHGAAGAAAAQSEAGVQIAMGALFILLGFFTHALLRNRDRRVHITIKPKTPMTTKIEKREWYWVHLHV